MPSACSPCETVNIMVPGLESQNRESSTFFSKNPVVDEEMMRWASGWFSVVGSQCFQLCSVL